MPVFVYQQCEKAKIIAIRRRFLLRTPITNNINTFSDKHLAASRQWKKIKKTLHESVCKLLIMGKNQITFWVDESQNTLIVKTTKFADAFYSSIILETNYDIHVRLDFNCFLETSTRNFVRNIIVILITDFNRFVMTTTCQSNIIGIIIKAVCKVLLKALSSRTIALSFLYFEVINRYERHSKCVDFLQFYHRCFISI